METVKEIMIKVVRSRYLYFPYCYQKGVRVQSSSGCEICCSYVRESGSRKVREPDVRMIWRWRRHRQYICLSENLEEKWPNRTGWTD